MSKSIRQRSGKASFDPTNSVGGNVRPVGRSAKFPCLNRSMGKRTFLALTHGKFAAILKKTSQGSRCCTRALIFSEISVHRLVGI